MKYRHSYCHRFEHENLCVYLNGKEVLTIKNIEKMANISIDIEDNQTDLATLVTNVQTAFTGLQNSTLSGLSQALADLETALNALAAFQISFTASVAPPPAA
jgi:hypothetical protein